MVPDFGDAPPSRQRWDGGRDEVISEVQAVGALSKNPRYRRTNSSAGPLRGPAELPSTRILAVSPIGRNLPLLDGLAVQWSRVQNVSARLQRSSSARRHTLCTNGPEPPRTRPRDSKILGRLPHSGQNFEPAPATFSNPIGKFSSHF